MNPLTFIKLAVIIIGWIESLIRILESIPLADVMESIRDFFIDYL